MSAFNDIEEAVTYAKSVIDQTSASANWSDEDVSAIKGIIDNCYSAHALSVIDSMRDYNLLSAIDVTDSYAEANASHTSDFWSELSTNLAASEYTILDRMDEVISVFESAVTASESAKSELEANQLTTQLAGATDETVSDIKEAGEEITEPTNYIGPIALGVVLLAIIFAVK